MNLLLMSIFDQIGSILEICSAREISHRSFWNCIHIGFMIRFQYKLMNDAGTHCPNPSTCLRRGLLLI